MQMSEWTMWIVRLFFWFNYIVTLHEICILSYKGRVKTRASREGAIWQKSARCFRILEIICVRMFNCFVYTQIHHTPSHMHTGSGGCCLAVAVVRLVCFWHMRFSAQSVWMCGCGSGMHSAFRFSEKRHVVRSTSPYFVEYFTMCWMARRRETG